MPPVGCAATVRRGEGERAYRMIAIWHDLSYIVPNCRRRLMAFALVEVDTEARPFTPEPITDEEGAAMFRAARVLLARWGLTDDQAATLLDMPVRTFRRWKAGQPGRLGRDDKARLSNLLG